MKAVHFFAVALVVLPAACSSKTPTVNQPPKGPRNGLLVKLSDEHAAEFTVDHDRQQAIVYVMDAGGKEERPIAGSLSLALQRPASNVALQAWPQASDPPGSSSRFAVRLPFPTRGRKLAGTLSARIGAAAYSGQFDQQKDYALRKAER